jgi:hypothetical protein
MRLKPSLLIAAGILVGGSAAAYPALATPAHTAGGSGSTSCNDGTVQWSPTTLWPPNHKMQTINISYTDTDGDGDSTSISVSSITDNQMTGGVEDVGAGNPHLSDWSGVGNSGMGSDPSTPATTTAQVRAERSGPNGSRLYTISVMCSDMGGTDVAQNGTASLTVTVPHDQGNNA